MATPVKKSFYKNTVNGVTYYYLLPDYNVSPTLTKVTNPQEVQDYVTSLRGMGQYVPGSRTGVQFDAASLANQTEQLVNEYKSNPTSDYVLDDKGNFTTQKKLDEETYWKAEVKAGRAREVQIGGGVGYVPIGSAADQQMQGGGQGGGNPPPKTQVLGDITGGGNSGSSPTASYPMTALQPGMSNDGVRQLQNFLISQGYQIPAGATGYYGDQTKAAVAKFQTDKGIDTKGNAGYWGPLTVGFLNTNPTAIKNTAQNNTQTGGAETGTGTGAKADTSWLQNDPDFKALPQDLQDYLLKYYDVLNAGSAEATQKLQDALKTAKDQADPYYKQIIGLAQDDLMATLGANKADFASKERDLTNKINQIEQDLATGKEDLSIDQHAELVRQSRDYRSQLEGLRASNQQTGLTYSSNSDVAKERLSQGNQGIVESTKTKYMRQARDLELAAARGDESARNQLSDFKRILGEQQMAELRSAEAKLGTANLPDVSSFGLTPKGGISGQVEEDKIKDIYTRAEALSNLGKLSY